MARALGLGVDRSSMPSRRCLIPASAFFEFAGKTSPKAKHRFTLNGAPFMAIAGLWRDGECNKPLTFGMLTTEPGPDVAPIHSRQIVVLRPQDWAAWIHLTKPEAELLKTHSRQGRCGRNRTGGERLTLLRGLPYLAAALRTEQRKPD